MPPKRSPILILWIALSAALLAGMTVEHWVFREPPARADAYHAAVGDAIDQLPYTFDQWVGQDSAVPEAAVRLLRANRVFSRRFVHLESGQAAQVLIVHCTDSRDLIGHYPPNCYPANGWRADGSRAIALDPDHLDGFDATVYEFSRVDETGDQQITLFNFMVLPDGQIARDMNAVSSASQDYRRKFFGAAQVQVLVPASLKPELQVALAERLIDFIHPVLRTIRSGVNPT